MFLLMVILHMIQKLPPCLALVLAPRVITLQTLLELRTLIIWWFWVIHKDSLRLWWSLCVILLLFLLAQLPRSKSQDPRPRTQEPRAKSQAPRAEIQEPRAESQDPRPKQTGSSKFKIMLNQKTMSIYHDLYIYIVQRTT